VKLDPATLAVVEIELEDHPEDGEAGHRHGTEHEDED
jgi:hypothetical protein